VHLFGALQCLPGLAPGSSKLNPGSAGRVFAVESMPTRRRPPSPCDVVQILHRPTCTSRTPRTVLISIAAIDSKPMRHNPRRFSVKRRRRGDGGSHQLRLLLRVASRSLRSLGVAFEKLQGHPAGGLFCRIRTTRVRLRRRPAGPRKLPTGRWGPLRLTVPQFHATAVTLSSSSGDLSLTTTRHSHDARDALLKSAITRSVESNFRRTAAFGTVATRRSALL
jgi:hypothetical protein